MSDVCWILQMGSGGGRRAAVLVWLLLIRLSAAAGAKTATVVPPKAEVRSAPTRLSPVIGIAWGDARIDVSDPPENGWRVVHLANGGAGYVRNEDLHFEGPPEEPGCPVGAVPGPRRLTCPWIVRFDLTAAGEGWNPLASSTNSIGGLSLTLGRSFSERLATEVTLGTDLPDEHFAGLILMAVARSAIVFKGLDRSEALTLAAGPILITGGVYDTVAFGHAELAYEVRGPKYTFLLAAGPDVAFNDSARQTTIGCGNVLGLFGSAEPPCVLPFNRGEVFLHLRIGVGWTFGGPVRMR